MAQPVAQHVAQAYCNPPPLPPTHTPYIGHVAQWHGGTRLPKPLPATNTATWHSDTVAHTYRTPSPPLPGSVPTTHY